jgi:hypothetical protein
MPAATATKNCGRCGQEKEASEFWADKSKPDGLQWACKQCLSQCAKDRLEQEPGKCRAQKRDHMQRKSRFYADKRRLDRTRVIAHYGGHCACCGEDRPEFLAIDHIDGGGNAHRRELGVRGGHEFVTWLIENDFPEGFRILCHNCNMAMGAYGICPHQVEIPLVREVV